MLLNSILNLYNNNLSTLIYFVTYRCNASCEMCYNYNNLNTDIKELSFSEVQSICKNLKRITLLQCTGGEPFLKENIFDILNSFAAISNAITIPTNGFLPEKIERVVAGLVMQNKNTLIRVALSIDGIGELHDKIRNRQGGFDLTTETFYRLKNIRNKHKNLLLTCNTVFTSSNYKKIEEIVDYCNDLGVDSHTITYMWGEPKNHPSLVAPIDSYKQAISYAYAKKNHITKVSTMIMHMINRLADLIMIEVLEKRKQVIHCKSIRKFAVMSPDGNIMPCHMRKEVLGNVRDYQYNIDNILKNDTSKQLIKKIHDTKCFCFVQCNTRNKVVYNIKSFVFLLKYLFQGKIVFSYRMKIFAKNLIKK